MISLELILLNTPLHTNYLKNLYCNNISFKDNYTLCQKNSLGHNIAPGGKSHQWEIAHGLKTHICETHICGKITLWGTSRTLGKTRWGKHIFWKH